MVSFRFPDPLYGKLLAKAALHDLSAGEYARLLVTEVLQDENRQQVLQAVQDSRTEFLRAMKSQFEKLGSNLGAVLEAVLLNLTEVTEADVESWVRDNLKT